MARNDFVLPIAATLAAAALAAVGYWASGTGLNQLFKLALFSLAALFILHVVYWLCRKVTSDKAIRSVDYVYLAIAVCGIFGILDIQANLIQPQVLEIRDRHEIDLEDLKL